MIFLRYKSEQKVQFNTKSSTRIPNKVFLNYKLINKFSLHREKIIQTFYFRYKSGIFRYESGIKIKKLSDKIFKNFGGYIFRYESGFYRYKSGTTVFILIITIKSNKFM